MRQGPRWRFGLKRGIVPALALAPVLALATAVLAPAAPLRATEFEIPADVREALASAAAIEAEHGKVRGELDALAAEIGLTQETAARLDAEIATFSQDRDAIRQAMIEATEAQRRAGAEIAASEGEISRLRAEEGGVQRSLFARRDTLAQVLGALERMGRRPPPAVLVHPDDALGSVRSAILLGSVVPAIRAETDALRADLDRLTALAADIERQRDMFTAGLTRQREEEERLARLFAEKERLEADRRQTRDDMSRRTAELAGRADSLQDLIGALEADLASARDAEEAARRAEEARLAALARESEESRAGALAEAERDAERSGRVTMAARDRPVEQDAQAGAEPDGARGYDIASLRRDMAQLEVSAPFSTLEGSLVPPVVGEITRAFGQDDGFGRRSDGMIFSARAGELVTAPADGRILYSGAFRSYGQLLILNAGDGYHIVLAGMREIDVDVGQFVLAGEPIAVMGSRRLASAGAVDLPSTQPDLYVEFRNDGKPVDPGPWWMDGASGRTGNDS